MRRVDIGTDLSFCIADLRSQRTAKTLLPAKDLAKVEAWASSLTTPGVLVVSQLLLRGKGSSHDHTWPTSRPSTRSCSA